MAEDQYENKNAGELRDILKSITGELSRQRSIQAESAAEYRKMDSIARQLQDTTMGISKLSSEELAKLGEKNKNHIKELQYQAERLARQKMGIKFDGIINQATIDRFKFLGKLTVQEEAILRAAADKYEIERDITKEVEAQYTKRLAFEKQVNKSLGVSGAIIGGIDAVMSKLGMNSGIFKEAIQESKRAMQEAAEQAALNGTHISRTSVLMKGLSPLAKGFGKALFDPLTIITKVLDTYFKINKASVDAIHLTGQNAVNAASLGANYASAVDYLETLNELTKKTGMNAQNIFSEKVIGQAAALKTTMGLTADEAGGLATMSQTSGKSVDGMVDSIVATTSAFNGANRAAVSQGVVLKEVANTSDSIKLSLGNNPEALTKAAAAATRLGLSLQDVDNIASSLTDFQSSISNELEAELLTGKDLNLEKARELALNNDLEGVSKELFKNSSDIAEFGKMNRIQQEAYAKSLGMTKDQLAKMAYNKALEAGMTADQAAAAANVNAEDMKRVAIQENFAKALEKIAGAVAPILDIVGNILSIPLVPYLLMGALVIGKMGTSLVGVVGSMKNLALGAKDLVTNLAKGGAGGVAGRVKSMFSGDQAVAAEGAVPKESGKGMSGLTDSIQKIKPTQLLAGAAALVLVAASVYVFAKAAQEFATVSWEDMAKAGVGLLGLVGALALVGAIMTSGVGAIAIVAGAAAIVIMAGGLYVLGKALQEVGEGMALMEPALALVSSIGDKAAGLATIGASLMGIAGGLKEIAAAGAGAIPVLDSLANLGGSRSVGEAKNKSDEGSLAAVEKKLEDLIAAVRAGGNVYMDSNKVGRAQVLGSYKSA